MRANKLELFTSKYYAACAVGGMMSAGSIHFLITPFDMLKVNMQVSKPLSIKIQGSQSIELTGIWHLNVHKSVTLSDHES